jgi:hypothetical protein
LLYGFYVAILAESFSVTNLFYIVNLSKINDDFLAISSETFSVWAERICVFFDGFNIAKRLLSMLPFWQIYIFCFLE